MENIDLEVIKEILRRSQRAEYARIRYHSMGPTQRLALNEERSKKYFGKKARERYIMAKTSLTVDEYLELQQIMVRRKVRADKARLRYHQMSLEEKRIYNEKCIERGKRLANQSNTNPDEEKNPRGRGRPRKVKIDEKIPATRGRGRPRKSDIIPDETKKKKKKAPKVEQEPTQKSYNIRGRGRPKLTYECDILEEAKKEKKPQKIKQESARGRGRPRIYSL